MKRKENERNRSDLLLSDLLIYRSTAIGGVLLYLKSQTSLEIMAIYENEFFIQNIFSVKTAAFFILKNTNKRTPSLTVTFSNKESKT